MHHYNRAVVDVDGLPLVAGAGAAMPPGPATLLSDAPHVVTRGANSQSLPEGRDGIVIDWLRLSGPRAVLHDVKWQLEERFGRYENCKGRWFYSAGWAFAGGVFVFFDTDMEGVEHFSVEIPGSALQSLEFGEVIELAANLMGMGLRATRIDLAFDSFGRRGLCEKAIRSCEAGELCGAKTYQEHRLCGSSGIVGHTVYIGKRGKLGSGRFVRIYDKGLESGTAERGAWERYEVEFSGDTAAEVAERVVLADDPVTTALGFIKGAVEFRLVTGDKNRKRRPLVKWYAELFDGTDVQFARIKRSKTTLESFSAWLRRCVAPTMKALEMSANVDLVEVWRDLVGDVPVEFDVYARPVVYEWLKYREKRRVA